MFKLFFVVFVLFVLPSGVFASEEIRVNARSIEDGLVFTNAYTAGVYDALKDMSQKGMTGALVRKAKEIKRDFEEIADAIKPCKAVAKIMQEYGVPIRKGSLPNVISYNQNLMEQNLILGIAVDRSFKTVAVAISFEF